MGLSPAQRNRSEGDEREPLGRDRFNPGIGIQGKKSFRGIKIVLKYAYRIYEMVPGLVFEVVSEGSEERDYVAKRREYYDLGIREYTIVDPFRKALTALTRGSQDYIDNELKSGQVYTSAQLPKFELSVADLPW